MQKKTGSEDSQATDCGLSAHTKIAIVGSRSYPKKQDIADYIVKLGKNVEIVSGGQPKGVDGWAKQCALEQELNYTEFTPAHYPRNNYSRNYTKKKYNIKNYFERNTEIVKFSDKITVFMQEESPGSMHVLRECHRLKKEHEVFNRFCPYCG